jgi:hypothetical protein
VDGVYGPQTHNELKFADTLSEYVQADCAYDSPI